MLLITKETLQLNHKEFYILKVHKKVKPSKQDLKHHQEGVDNERTTVMVAPNYQEYQLVPVVEEAHYFEALLY
jgi:hypothetical protein